MNGIHEVTGSIPVWSTILRSWMQAKDAHHSVALKGLRDATVGCRYGERASDGRPPFAHAVSRIAESPAIGHRHYGDYCHAAATAVAISWEFHGS